MTYGEPELNVGQLSRKFGIGIAQPPQQIYRKTMPPHDSHPPENILHKLDAHNITAMVRETMGF
jgi:hypothetical protein